MLCLYMVGYLYSTSPSKLRRLTLLRPARACLICVECAYHIYSTHSIRQNERATNSPSHTTRHPDVARLCGHGAAGGCVVIKR